jgi:hypothetical protein
VTPTTIALYLSIAANLWLAVTRIAARRTARALDHDLYLASRASTHAINGTQPGDPEVQRELATRRFFALVEAETDRQHPGRRMGDLTDIEMTAVRRAARRTLVLAGHLAINDAYGDNLRDLTDAGLCPSTADQERTETVAQLALIAQAAQ